MEDNNVDKNMDWEKLSIKLKSKMRHKLTHKTIVAVMPMHPPVRIMTGFTEGIYPTTEVFMPTKTKKE